jgi:hypothetical protein
VKNLFKSLTLAFGVAALSVSAMAQDSGPLLDALVKKGVLSDSEAEDIRVNLVKEYNSTSAGKLQISSFVKNLQLFGDARLRYQYQDIQTPQAASGSGGIAGRMVDTVNDRYRYRLRVGANYTYDSHWSATVRLETGSTNDSANADWGNYWDKNGNADAIRVGQLFLTYKTKFSLFDSSSTVADGKSYKTINDPGITIGSSTQIGRGPKQILLSGAFWSVDANPEGLAEEVTFENVGIDGLSFAARGAGYLTSNDQAVAPTGTSTTSSDTDGGLFLAQLEGKYAFSSGALKGTSVRVAPLFLQESSGGGLGLTSATQPVSGAAALGSNNGAGAINQQGNLTVVAVPVEVNWKSDWFGLFGKAMPQQFFGTYGANLNAADRNTEMYGLGTHVHGNNTFWNAGYTLGQNKAKGDFSITPEWRWIEAASYTSNLTDSNFANGVVNQQGLALTASYNVTDAVIVTGTYYHSNPINGTSPVAGTVNGANSYGAIANQGSVDIFQADLVWKF